MYIITIKYKTNKGDDVIKEYDYSKACEEANVWGKTIKSVHLKEIR